MAIKFIQQDAAALRDAYNERKDEYVKTSGKNARRHSGMGSAKLHRATIAGS